MRLTPIEIDGIKKSLKSLDPCAQIFLYGSRTNDQLSGGDIDLVVISETLKFTDKLTLLVELKTQLGDQKIDLTICSADESKKNPFIAHVLSQAIPL